MAQPMTNVAAGRVNRRFLLLALILAALSAVLYYAVISRSGSDGEGAAAGTVPVVVASAAIPAGTIIQAQDLEIRQISETGVGDLALADIESAVGQVARYPIAANEQVLLSKLVGTTIGSTDVLSYILANGMRGVGLQIDQVISAGGLVLPGDHVDVLWVPFKGAPAFVLFSDVEVTAVAQTVLNIAPAAPGLQVEPADGEEGAGLAADDRARTSDAEAQPASITVTLMLTPAQMTTLFCAEEHATHFEGDMRLAVRSFGDAAPVALDAPECPPRDLVAELSAEG